MHGWECYFTSLTSPLLFSNSCGLPDLQFPAWRSHTLDLDHCHLMIHHLCGSGHSPERQMKKKKCSRVSKHFEKIFEIKGNIKEIKSYIWLVLSGIV